MWDGVNTSLIVAGLGAALVALAGGLLTTVGPWYRQLRKPSLQPPDWLFGPAWTVILAMAAWSASIAWRAAPGSAGHAAVLAAFAVNAVFHLLWTPLFFNLRRPDWALVEVGFLWSSVAAAIVVTGQFSSFAAWLLAPYLVWVSFAAWLNYSIVRLNKPFSTHAGLRRLREPGRQSS